MLSEVDYQEAVRRYKNMKVNGHERQRYHALILVHQGYSYREVGEILLVDEDTIGRWVRQYQERGLGGLKNDGQWGGEHGQRELGPEQVEELKRILREEAMPGTKVGSGWTNKAVRQLLAERFGVTYSKSGVRKLFAHMGWSYQRGRKLYIRRDPVDQARYELRDAGGAGQIRTEGEAGGALSERSEQSVFGRDAGAALESDWAATGGGGRSAAEAGRESVWGGAFGHGGGGGTLCD